MILGSPPRRFTALRIAARSTTSGTPVKSCRTIRATTNGISSLAGFFASHLAKVSTSLPRTFLPSQLHKTHTRTQRVKQRGSDDMQNDCFSDTAGIQTKTSRSYTNDNLY